MHFTSSSYRLASQVKHSTAKKIHPETGGWFLEAYSVMTIFRAKAINSFANGTNSIAKTCIITDNYWIYNLHKDSLAVKKGVAMFKRKKSCEIKGGGQELAVMVQVDGKKL